MHFSLIHLNFDSRVLVGQLVCIFIVDSSNFSHSVSTDREVVRKKRNAIVAVSNSIQEKNDSFWDCKQISMRETAHLTPSKWWIIKSRQLV